MRYFKAILKAKESGCNTWLSEAASFTTCQVLRRLLILYLFFRFSFCVCYSGTIVTFKNKKNYNKEMIFWIRYRKKNARKSLQFSNNQKMLQPAYAYCTLIDLIFLWHINNLTCYRFLSSCSIISCPGFKQMQQNYCGDNFVHMYFD